MEVDKFVCVGVTVMKNLFNQISVVLISLCLTIGCASTEVTNHQTFINKKIPRPDQILVHDFVATPADIPADSALASQASELRTPQTAEQIATGRQVGAEIAAQLVEQICDMGLPAKWVTDRTKPGINDIVIRGYLLSIDKGSTEKRIAIGFGFGASELRTAVEVYQMTNRGLRKLDSDTVDSGGNKFPGATTALAVTIAGGNPLGLIVSTGMKVYGEVSGNSTIEGRTEQTAKEIANQLRTRFEQQGWVN